ncbi:hypothetical protein G7054_g2166 [Neopestalotiopsis clavispora]|nr:hypothetical protein G7054_g2166 [Neopestalotiopsis clavispora]
MDVTDCKDPFSVSPGQVDDRRNSSVNNVIHPVSESATQTTSSSTSPTSSTTSATSSATTTPATDGENGSSNSEVLKVALGVGLGVGLPLLAVLIVTLWSLRKTRQQLVEAKSGRLLASQQGSVYQQEYTGHGHQSYPLKPNMPSPGAASVFQQQQVYQPQVSSFPRELDGNTHVAEFPSDHSYEASWGHEHQRSS